MIKYISITIAAAVSILTSMSTFALAPEHLRALEVLKESMPKLDELPNSLFIEPVPHDYKAFFTRNQLVKQDLPHGDNWCWNQSNAGIVTNVDGKYVNLRKFNVRSLEKGGESPRYKLWLYDAFEPAVEEPYEKWLFSFIWCEKGDISEADLSFIFQDIEPNLLDIVRSLNPKREKKSLVLQRSVP